MKSRATESTDGHGKRIESYSVFRDFRVHPWLYFHVNSHVGSTDHTDSARAGLADRDHVIPVLSRVPIRAWDVHARPNYEATRRHTARAAARSFRSFADTRPRELRSFGNTATSEAEL